jgi:hypothetical protein
MPARQGRSTAGTASSGFRLSRCVSRHTPEQNAGEGWLPAERCADRLDIALEKRPAGTDDDLAPEDLTGF